MKQRAKISESDKEQIERLRAAVKDEITEYYDTDFNLLRWLIGHNYNFDIIIPKLRNHLRFRRSSWDLDKCTEQPRDHAIHRFWKAGITGKALRTPNVIVNIEQSGTNDYWGMLATFPINELMKARVYDLEMMLKKVMEMESETGEQASILYVMDLNGLKYDKKLLDLVTGALAGISSFMSENYVEMVHSFVLVNAPSFISTIWSIARPLLPERTRNKVQIFGSNWRNDILTLAVPEVLPTYWNDDKNNIFKANIERSEPIDPANYYKDGALKDSKMITIAAGKADFVTISAQKVRLLLFFFITIA
uniref:CRAL-TRIO domain-containing protein n=1 Tax=Ascaris lumbricoides TaxID=6252 RepID=A0A0M3IJ30_ASCLU